MLLPAPRQPCGCGVWASVKPGLAGVHTLALPPAQALPPPPPRSRCTHTPSHLKDKAERNGRAQILTGFCAGKHFQNRVNKNKMLFEKTAREEESLTSPAKVENSELAILPTEGLVFPH